MAQPLKAWGRWRVMLLAWLVQAPVCYFGWPLLVWDPQTWGLWGDPRYASTAGVLLALMMLAQALVVMPYREDNAITGLPPPRREMLALAGLLGACAGYCSLWLLFSAVVSGRLPLDAIFAPAVGAAVMTLVFVVVFVALAVYPGVREIGQWVRAVVIGGAAAHMVLALILVLVSQVSFDGRPLDVRQSMFSGVLLLVAQWVIYSVVVYMALTRPGADAPLRKIVPGLFIAAILEFWLLLVLDLLGREVKEEIFGKATVWAVTFCFGAMMLLGAPAVILSSQRKPKEAPRCRSCGYDMSGILLAAMCPECGAEFESKGRAVRVMLRTMRAEQGRAMEGGKAQRESEEV